MSGWVGAALRVRYSNGLERNALRTSAAPSGKQGQEISRMSSGGSWLGLRRDDCLGWCLSCSNGRELGASSRLIDRSLFAAVRQQHPKHRTRTPLCLFCRQHPTTAPLLKHTTSKRLETKRKQIFQEGRLRVRQVGHVAQLSPRPPPPDVRRQRWQG